MTTNTLSDELVEREVAKAIALADNPGTIWEADFSFHAKSRYRQLARAALEASGIERIQEEARKGFEGAIAVLRRTHDDILLGSEPEDTLSNINAEIRRLRALSADMGEDRHA